MLALASTTRSPTWMRSVSRPRPIHCTVALARNLPPLDTVTSKPWVSTSCSRMTPRPARLKSLLSPAILNGLPSRLVPVSTTGRCSFALTFFLVVAALSVIVSSLPSSPGAVNASSRLRADRYVHQTLNFRLAQRAAVDAQLVHSPPEVVRAVKHSSDLKAGRCSCGWTYRGAALLIPVDIESVCRSVKGVNNVMPCPGRWVCGHEPAARILPDSNSGVLEFRLDRDLLRVIGQRNYRLGRGRLGAGGEPVGDGLRSVHSRQTGRWSRYIAISSVE